MISLRDKVSCSCVETEEGSSCTSQEGLEQRAIRNATANPMIKPIIPHRNILNVRIVLTKFLYKKDKKD